MEATTSLVTGVDFVHVPTQDIDAAVEFYGDVLGLPVLKRYGRMPGVEFQAGNLTLAVIEPTAFGMEFHPNRNVVAFHVDDVAEAREGLASQGVEFLADTIDSGVCHMAPFSDRDGNVLMLHNRYAPPDARPPGMD